MAHQDHTAASTYHQAMADVTCTAANTWYGVDLPKCKRVVTFRGGSGYIAYSRTDIDAGTSLTNCAVALQDVPYELSGSISSVYLAHTVAGGKACMVYG